MGPTKFFTLESPFRIKVDLIKNIKTDSVINRPDLQTGQRPNIEIVDLMERGITLGLPARSCAQGNPMELKLIWGEKELDQSFEAEGFVVRVVDINKLFVLVEIEFQKYHSNQWLEIAKKHEDLQHKLNKMHKAMQGRG